VFRSPRAACAHCETIVATTTLPALFHPPALKPAALLQSVEQWIKRRHVESQGAARARLDRFADVVTVPRPGLDKGQNSQLGAALLTLPVMHSRTYICHSHILRKRSRQSQEPLVWLAEGSRKHPLPVPVGTTQSARKSYAYCASASTAKGTQPAPT
jgi:hypothetical protein